MAFDFVLHEQIDSLKQRERKDQIYPIQSKPHILYQKASN